MGPGTLGVAATQVNVYVNTVLATSQQPGAVSWLNYAFRILYLPIGLFGVSIASAVAAAASRSTPRARTCPRCGTRCRTRCAWCWRSPCRRPSGSSRSRVPIVRVIFERGRFLPSDTEAVAMALMGYAPGLVGYSAVKVLSPTFYALRDSRTPVDRQRDGGADERRPEHPARSRVRVPRARRSAPRSPSLFNASAPAGVAAPAARRLERRICVDWSP